MPSEQLDAFIAFNDKECNVARIVQDLELHGVETFISQRDMPVGAEWKVFERDKLNATRTVVVFLGDQGWEQNHLAVAENAVKLKKHVIPVLIGNPPGDAFGAADALFRDRRYLDMREMGADSLASLIDVILSPKAPEKFNQPDTSNRYVIEPSEVIQKFGFQPPIEEQQIARDMHSLYERARDNAVSALRYSVFGFVGIVVALLLNSPPILFLLQQIPDEVQRVKGLSSVEPIRWTLFFVMLVFTLASLFIMRDSWKQMQEAHQLSKRNDEII